MITAYHVGNNKSENKGYNCFFCCLSLIIAMQTMLAVVKLPLALFWSLFPSLKKKISKESKYSNTLTRPISLLLRSAAVVFET